MTIHQVENSRGHVELKMDPAIRKMSRELTKMNQSLSPYISQALDLCKDVSFHMDKTADAINRLGMNCASIHKCYKAVADKFDFDSLSKIEGVYADLSKTLTSYSRIVNEERDNFSLNIENFFNFAVSEIEGIDEVDLVSCSCSVSEMSSRSSTRKRGSF